MRFRPFGLVIVLASTAVLAACEGTMGTGGAMVGTVEGEDAPTGSPAPSDAATSGVDADPVSTAASTATPGTDGSGSLQGRPLDDPAGPLATRTIHFEFDSSEVPESERGAIEAHARYLSSHAGAQITLEGHADERGSREYNVALGERRADAVRRLLTLLGANDPQIRTISYGEERPAAPGHDESAWGLNRRVEIIYRVRE